MRLTLTKEQLEVLIHLVENEMSRFCGDLGYSELSKVREVLQQQIKLKTLKDSHH